VAVARSNVRAAAQVIRFGVGTPAGLRSVSWRLWVPPGKSDVYVAQRHIGGSIKVSLHDEGPWRYALTADELKRPGGVRAPGPDPRGAQEWAKPLPNEDGLTRALSILVPDTELRERTDDAPPDVVWLPPPAAGLLVQFDVIYAKPGADARAAAEAHERGVIGDLLLANGDRVHVFTSSYETPEPTRQLIDRVRRDLTPTQAANAFAVDKDGVGVVVEFDAGVSPAPARPAR
jgi:hypothetical protein